MESDLCRRGKWSSLWWCCSCGLVSKQLDRGPWIEWGSVKVGVGEGCWEKGGESSGVGRCLVERDGQEKFEERERRLWGAQRG